MHNPIIKKKTRSVVLYRCEVVTFREECILEVFSEQDEDNIYNQEVGSGWSFIRRNLIICTSLQVLL
jgi:hypothetical protein